MDDREAIRNLIYSYAELLDLGDFDALRSWFGTATVYLDGTSEPMSGSAAFQELVERPVRLYDGVPSTKHLVTNVIIEVAGDGQAAVARSYYVAYQARPELPLQPIIAGRWFDRFERRGGVWEIVERVIHADLLGNLSYHVKSPAAEGGTAG